MSNALYRFLVAAIWAVTGMFIGAIVVVEPTPETTWVEPTATFVSSSWLSDESHQDSYDYGYPTGDPIPDMFDENLYYTDGNQLPPATSGYDALETVTCPVTANQLEQMLQLTYHLSPANHGGPDTVCAFTSNGYGPSIIIDMSTPVYPVQELQASLDQWLSAGNTLTGQPHLGTAAYSVTTDHGNGMGIATFTQHDLLFEVQVGDNYTPNRTPESTATLVANLISDNLGQGK
jgi:hypothetical protein